MNRPIVYCDGAKTVAFGWVMKQIHICQSRIKLLSSTHYGMCLKTRLLCKYTTSLYCTIAKALHKTQIRGFQSHHGQITNILIISGIFRMLHFRYAKLCSRPVVPKRIGVWPMTSVQWGKFTVLRGLQNATRASLCSSCSANPVLPSSGLSTLSCATLCSPVLPCATLLNPAQPCVTLRNPAQPCAI
jgi:hypothetical protein